MSEESRLGREAIETAYALKQLVTAGVRVFFYLEEAPMNTRTFRRITALGITLTLFGTHLAAQGADPIIGTWVLNVAKSTFSPGPAPKSETRTYVMEGQETKVTSKGASEPRTYKTVRQEIKATSTGIDSDGKPTTREWTVVYDGKDRPMTGDPDADMLSLKRIDAFTTEFTQKKAGRVVITGTRAISKDGNVMTITTKGINAKGQTTSNVSVFEKQ